MTAAAVRRALFIGFLAGAAGWHLSLVGLVPAFAERRLIGDVVTFSSVLLVALVAVATYLTARRYQGAVRRVLYGLVSALTTALLLVLLAVVVTEFNLRQIFLNATPELARTLTFGAGPTVNGLLRVLGIAVLTGLLTGGIGALPAPWGRILVFTTLTTLLFGLLRDVLTPVLPSALTGFLYGSSGLSYPGSVVLFAVFLALFVLRWTVGGRTTSSTVLSTIPPGVRRPLATGLLLALFASIPLWAGLFLTNVIDFVGFYILMGLGLNLVLGFAGLLDLGYVAFFAVGAYTMAVLTSPEIAPAGYILDFWLALPLAVLITVFAGLLVGLPVLRMRGDYLAIATLGFGEIVRLLVLSDWLKPYLGGAQGVTRIGRPHLGSLRIDSPQEFYFLILLSCLLAWFLSVRLRDSRLGRAWFAIREDEHVAQAMGINRVTAKLTAFAIGASFGGLSGALFASLVGSVVPASFSLLVSINVVALLVLGGMGSLPGVLVGALALVGIPELLREFQEYRLLLYGMVLIAMMLFRPAGLLPERIHRVELEEAVEEAREITPAELATGQD